MSQRGLVFINGSLGDVASALSKDAPRASITTSAALYRAVDERLPAATAMYSVSDISALPQVHNLSNDRRRVYAVTHDTDDTAPTPTEPGSTLLLLSAQHTDRNVLREFYHHGLAIIRSMPGWRRARRVELVEGAPGVLNMMMMYDFVGDDFLASDEFERYARDPERIRVIGTCTGNERRIFHFEKHIPFTTS